MVASFIVVGVMSVIALGLLEPANIAVLFELKKPRPSPEVIERLMKRFIYSAGILGAMQIATLVIMTKLATRMSERTLPPVTELGMASLALIVAGGIYLSAHLPQHVPLAPAVVLLAASALLLAINLIAARAGQGTSRGTGSSRSRSGRCSPTW